jgi:hypothetical protein
LLNIQSLPDDIIRSFCSYLTFIQILKLEGVSKRFHKVKNYITNISYSPKKLNDNSHINNMSKIIKVSSSLKKLDLNFNNIGTTGIKLFAQYLSKSLQILKFYNIDLTNEGLEILSPHLPSSLLEIDFGCNHINDDSIDILIKHLPSSLKILNLELNCISVPLIEKLKRITRGRGIKLIADE